MGKFLTYQSGNLFEWLLTISLAISLSTYSGYISFVEICQQQPQQVEWVHSGQSSVGNETISYDQFFEAELSHYTKKRSREYETHVRAALQSRIEVATKTISEQSASYPLTAFYQQIITVLHSSEESSSDISG
jgi:hypothetical protein